MEWAYFYDKYSELSESKIKSYISLLEDIDSGCELVDVITDVESVEVKRRLIEKALEVDLEFDLDDFARLDGEIPSELYARLSREGNITFGDAVEVTEVLSGLCDDAGIDALYKRAVSSGVRFTSDQLEYIGKEEDILEEHRDAHHTNTGFGFLGMLAILGCFFGSGKSCGANKQKKRRTDGRCDGDCENCPPHYGYRYGRWYYGHGHNYGCTRGGNKGGGGPD